MMPIETYFSQLNVVDEDPSTCCASTSSGDRRKKRRLNVPAPRSIDSDDDVAIVSELKRSSASRQLHHRHSHHAGDRLKDFYREVAPGLVSSSIGGSATRRSAPCFSLQDCNARSSPQPSTLNGGSRTNKNHKTIGSRFQDLIVRDTLLEYEKEKDSRRKNTRKSSPAAIEVRTVQQLLAKVESIVDV
eukprot:CAMPEP_0117048080 /NCGR_PEP_ID=MMETSP0472-20121206/33225_1 /TAXON_ID=693140 ORGANISM="Tiarina fusus, Strain LIS" /NCGR_SAMPLE_ID=MMETSP0472 /ASSEMBLY_ACC=CAM_ASM_000603 /LENGTH=187 /DNA_ID=CAMNT_0004761021 /DNA_START=101 /DNA_END=664 /DNA_ORIENTATION=+